MLLIVCALACEARPLITAMKLKVSERPASMPVYRAQDIALIVSGIGKSAAAAAASYLYAFTGEPAHTAFLNIGVAGHSGLAVGSIVAAGKVIDFSSGHCFYPVPATKLKIPSTVVYTVDVPEFSYPKEGAYDMEAFGFYSAAVKFSTAELIHCCKVISDNPQEKTAFSPSHIERLLKQNLDQTLCIVEGLAGLSRQMDSWSSKPESSALFLEKWHFTATQRNRLSQLLRRWAVCAPLSEELLDDSLFKLESAQAALNHIEKRINGLPLKFFPKPKSSAQKKTAAKFEL